MAKIAFIKPFQKAYYFSTSPPIGIAYLSSALKNKGHETALLDMRLYENTGTDLAVKWIHEKQPDIIGISAFACEAMPTHELAAALKARFPDAPIVVGGPYPSTAPARVMGDPNIDYCMIGEAEISFPLLVDHILEGEGPPAKIDAMAYRQDGETVINPPTGVIENLDDLPFPDWGLLDREAYFKMPRQQLFYINREYMPVFTSRGCPYNCLYCHKIFGRKFRPHSAERALEEINILHDRYGIKELQIIDDIFNYDLDRAKTITRGMIDSGNNMSISFPNAVRADRMDRELIELLKEARTFKMAYSVETGSERLQKLLRRNLKLDKTMETIETTDRVGIFQTGYFMLGFPSETEEEMRKTIDFALKSRLHTVAFFVVSVYEGTGLAELARSMGLDIDFASYERQYWRPSIQISEVPPEKLEKIMKNAYRRFYLNPRRLPRSVYLLPNKKQLFKSFQLFLNFAFLNSAKQKAGG